MAEENEFHLSFSAIVRNSPNKVEYWSAQELANLLGYGNELHDFMIIFRFAKRACKLMNFRLENHFKRIFEADFTVTSPKRMYNDYHLSKFGCFLVIMNCEAAKPEVIRAQEYFATMDFVKMLWERPKGRHIIQPELPVIPIHSELMSNLRNSFKDQETFDHLYVVGINSMYDGLNEETVKTLKGIPPEEDLLEKVGNVELAAHLFMITQTEQKVLSENIVEEDRIIEIHGEMGTKVRQAVSQMSGIMIEDLSIE